MVLKPLFGLRSARNPIREYGNKAVQKNKHGLPRYIGADVRRQIRQECGFGCVICGQAIGSYEHIEPTFEDAREHDPKRMALLCGSCHQKVTSGMWSKAKVWQARAQPKTFQQGAAKDAFDFHDPFEVHVGGNRIANVRCIVRTSQGDEWFSVKRSEDAGAPPLISAKFFGSDGAPALEIVNNEWSCSTGVWDLETVGRTITIRRDKGDVMLQRKR